MEARPSAGDELSPAAAEKLRDAARMYLLMTLEPGALLMDERRLVAARILAAQVQPEPGPGAWTAEDVGVRCLTCFQPLEAAHSCPTPSQGWCNGCQRRRGQVFSDDTGPRCMACRTEDPDGAVRRTAVAILFHFALTLETH